MPGSFTSEENPEKPRRRFSIPESEVELFRSLQKQKILAGMRTAQLEHVAFGDGTLKNTLDQQHKHSDWLLDFGLRCVFFLFALAINIWWDKNVLKMLWNSGRAGSGFHLSDSVLIALLTTAIGNFIGLLTIIANYLFRSSAKAEKIKDASIVAR